MTASAFTVAAATAILDANFAPWVRDSGLVIDAVGANSVTMRIPFSAHLCRVGGIMSGQTLAAGADTAMVLALAAAMGGVLKPCTTVDLSVNYMRPVTQGGAVLEAKVIRLGRTLAFCTTEISDAGSAKPAAFATGTYAIL